MRRLQSCNIFYNSTKKYQQQTATILLTLLTEKPMHLNVFHLNEMIHCSQNATLKPIYFQDFIKKWNGKALRIHLFSGFLGCQRVIALFSSCDRLLPVVILPNLLDSVFLRVQVKFCRYWADTFYLSTWSLSSSYFLIHQMLKINNDCVVLVVIYAAVLVVRVLSSCV